MSEEEALGVLQALLGQDGEKFTDSAYVFLRERRCVAPERKLNVVVIIMESWSGSYCGAVSGKKTVTPFFDSLASTGLLFTDFLASGQRSIEAAPSILASLPGLYTVSLIGSQAETNHYRGLGSILRENGYATSFHHGAATGSMGFDAFARIAGFERYFGKEDFRNPADSLFDHVWGLNDEPFFLDAVERISEMPKPSCSVLYTLSSHVPFEIPRHRKQLFEAHADDSEFERSMRYSDFALGQFFRAAELQPWFDSTVFVITGDHTMYGARNSAFATFNVPLLIIAPGLTPGRNTRIGSHVDILPTLLDILRLKTAHASMGSSLLYEGRTPFAVLRAGPEFMIFADSLLLIHDLEHPKGLYAFRRDEQSTNDLRSELPSDAARLERMLFAYVQTVTRAVAKDRVWKD
jgi:phosphoglycerol transferase MdoB-like AlkP superfamily enzyme